MKKLKIGIFSFITLFVFTGCDWAGYCYYHLFGDSGSGTQFLINPIPARKFIVNMSVPSVKYVYGINETLTVSYAIRNITNQPITVDYYLGATIDSLSPFFFKTSGGLKQAFRVNDINPTFAYRVNQTIMPNTTWTQSSSYTFTGAEGDDRTFRVFGVVTEAGDFSNNYGPDDNIEAVYLNVRTSF